ncbi:MAG: hypothetical protein FHP92_01525 [Denitromonas halophila]|nr:MAG: hypothetical protein FHP92_01525 [Denitromonas halophila]
MLVATIAAALLSGLGLGAGFYLIAAPFFLVPLGVYLLLRPDLCLVFFSGLTLLVAGSLKYFFGLGQFQWALSALGAALLGYAVIRTAFVKHSERVASTGIEQAMLLWWLCLLFSSVANGTPVLDWLVGLRIYLPVFGIFAYLAYCRPDRTLLKKILLFMIAISAIQWVFCLYQKISVVPIRIASGYPGSPWDSIVGSFGGEKFGGGESGSLGVYLSIAVVLAAALIKGRNIRPGLFFIVLVCAFAAMAMVESKVIALMVPLGCLFVYREYVFDRPARFLIGTVFVVTLMFGLLVAYYYLYWQEHTSRGLFDAIFTRLSYSFDPTFQPTSTNLGRIKSLVFWWDRHSILSDPLTLVLGHGLASAVSSSSIIGQGAAVTEFRTMLDVTGASKLLWETGLLGLSVFLSVFVFGFARANQLKSHPLLPPWHRAAMNGVGASMVLMPLSVFYEVTVVSSPPMQFVAMFLLGYVAYWWREVSGSLRVK